MNVQARHAFACTRTQTHEQRTLAHTLSLHTYATHARMHTHVHINKHTHKQTRKQAHTHAHTHTHTAQGVQAHGPAHYQVWGCWEGHVLHLQRHGGRHLGGRRDFVRKTLGWYGIRLPGLSSLNLSPSALSSRKTARLCPQDSQMVRDLSACSLFLSSLTKRDGLQVPEKTNHLSDRALCVRGSRFMWLESPEATSEVSPLRHSSLSALPSPCSVLCTVVAGIWLE